VHNSGVISCINSGDDICEQGISQEQCRPVELCCQIFGEPGTSRSGRRKRNRRSTRANRFGFFEAATRHSPITHYPSRSTPGRKCSGVQIAPLGTSKPRATVVRLTARNRRRSCDETRRFVDQITLAYWDYRSAPKRRAFPGV
jgi:hypothetical protein